MSRNTDLSTQTFNTKNANEVLTLEFENRIILTSSQTFVPPTAATAVRFTAVGGGGDALIYVGGAGAGLFQKTFYAPWVGLTTSFQLTVAAAGGDTTLADSAGTSIAKAFGATAIDGSNPVGVGGTSCGGELNTSGSPGGSSPGVGGASGGLIADSTYDSEYAGRWKYFQESIRNDNLKDYIIGNFYLSGGSVSIAGLGTNTVVAQQIDGKASGGIPAGLFSDGYDACTYTLSTTYTGTCGKGGDGGYGGNGGTGAAGRSASCPQPGPLYCYSGGPGGDGGYGGDGGCGGSFITYCALSGGQLATSGCPGGAGGYGGNGGNGRPGSGCAFVPACGGAGGTGGFGGRGGNGGNGSCHGCGYAYVSGGTGGTGGFGGGGGVGGFSCCCRGCGGVGGYGGGGGALNPTTTNTGCTARYGVGGAGAVIVEWTTRELKN